MERRSFLTGAAAGGAAALLGLGRAGAQVRPAPSNRIVMGCIGVGGQGSGNMRNFLGNPDVQVVAVADVDGNKRAGAKTAVDRQYGDEGCKVYADFRELLARGDLDAVSIATPDHWHGVTAVAAMKAGCDVYCEKPIAHSLVEGRAMADAQARYGRVFQVGSQQRSGGNFRWACEMVRNGRLGKVVRVEVGLPGGRPAGPVTFSAPPPQLDYDMWCGPSPVTPYCDKRTHWDWRWQLNYGGGQLMDWIGHHCDIGHWGMGYDTTGPVSVEGQGEYPTEGIWDAATTYRFTATYADGVQFVVGSSAPDLRSGTKWIGENGQWIWVNRGGTDSSPKSLLADHIGPGETPLYRSDNHHRNFVDCIKTRAQTICPAETGHRSASVGHLGQIAMRVGRKIRWNPVTEQILDDAAASAMLSWPMRSPWHV